MAHGGHRIKTCTRRDGKAGGLQLVQKHGRPCTRQHEQLCTHKHVIRHQPPCATAATPYLSLGGFSGRENELRRGEQVAAHDTVVCLVTPVPGGQNVIRFNDQRRVAFRDVGGAVCGTEEKMVSRSMKQSKRVSHSRDDVDNVCFFYCVLQQRPGHTRDDADAGVQAFVLLNNVVDEAANINIPVVLWWPPKRQRPHDDHGQVRGRRCHHGKAT